MGRIMGIDLGTTNSCVAIIEAGQPRVVPTREGSRVTPSIVAFTESGERLVGHIAKRQAVTNPVNTIYAVKRLMGRRHDSPEITRAQEILPYKIVEADNGDAYVSVRNRAMSPPEISAHILSEVRAVVEASVGDKVSDAVITVPAYFDDSQRQATKDAGKIAGINVLRIINEPTAAALAYGLHRGGEEDLVIVDLGGGTFDVTILHRSGGVFDVRATSGDTFLGGEDVDANIVDWLCESFLAETGIDLKSDRMALQRLKEAAEKAKCELSSEQEAAINLPFISADERGPRHLNITLTREKLDELLTDIIARMEGPCRQACEDAGLKPEDVDNVILVGGQTRTVKVQEFFKTFFHQKPFKDINPDEVVAVGAALQGGILEGEVRDLVLLDVTPLSLGIETHGGIFTRLIERNTTIPTSKSQIFTTVADNQSTVSVHVLQGEREMSRDNRSLGKFDLVGINQAPRGVPQIAVTFDIDSNGIVHVSAKDQDSGQEQAIQVTGAGGLSDEEILNVMKEAAEHAQEDKKRRESIALRNRVESMCFTLDRALKEFGRYLSDDQRKEAKSQLEYAQGKTADPDWSNPADIKEVHDQIRAATQELNEAMFLTFRPETSMSSPGEGLGGVDDASAKGDSTE